MKKDKDVIEIILDENDDMPVYDEADNPEIKRSPLADFFDGISPSFIGLTCGGAALFVLIALFAGILVPKSSGTVDRQLASLHGSDKTYVEKKTDYDALLSEEKQLNSHLEKTQEELDKFNKTQDNLDKLAQKNDELQKEKEQLQSDVSSKQNTLSALDASISSYSRSSITWPSGRYTVGENIAEGTYTIMGSGSIAISNSGTARVNKALRSDGEKFTLNSGDIIKIDGNAKLIPE